MENAQYEKIILLNSQSKKRVHKDVKYDNILTESRTYRNEEQDSSGWTFDKCKSSHIGTCEV